MSYKLIVHAPPVRPIIVARYSEVHTPGAQTHAVAVKGDYHETWVHAHDGSPIGFTPTHYMELQIAPKT
jgi:hypothetical protein